MCGITGFVGAGTREDLVAMTRAMSHRGPDGEGLYVDRSRAVHLGQRRLAIIDLAGGKQPMWNEDETVCVVYNGEIYNHAELRDELVAKGHVFRTSHSDTEVLVHGYEEWGVDLPIRLNGMFTFAIYDLRRGEVFLARDRFGEKPLYYTQQGETFAFASELTALTRHQHLSFEVDSRSLQKFFAHAFLPAPNALYKRCFKLPGGAHLTYRCADRSVTVNRYWRFELAPDEGLTDADEPRLVEELRALLIEATRRRLISDVPLGLFLSGGIDSGTVLAATARELPADRIRTFTIGFHEPSFDESAYAAALAEHFGTTHSVDMLALERARDLIPDVLSRMDEPLGDPSILPTYLLSKFTRQSVTVALSGDGGDELFAGYDPFKALAPARIYDAVMPRRATRGLRRLVEFLPRSDANMSLDFKLRRTLMGLSYPAAMWNPVWLGAVEPEALGDLFESPVHPEDLFSEVLEVWEAGRGKSLVDRTLEYYTNFYLPDDILMKVDRAAMMNSLESRAVFLDNDVAAFCQRLPSRFKMRGKTRKYLLKKALAGMLPDSVLARRKKGFGIPIGRWLKDLVPDGPLPVVGGMDAAHVQQAWQDHAAGRADHRLMLWGWLAARYVLEPAGGPRDHRRMAV